ncbi:hypothetical protein NHX12_015639 [Muraenolepis orangiensis]|uniref:Uncharacterized protein n=1 Tax=Muraenolepis orangiensis TaxID=630683 RepID=A0A9Q0D8G3_9TELE|nr:hypothetical protein NHX12_015639 [Muraenolepis orangiensis]
MLEKARSSPPLEPLPESLSPGSFPPLPVRHRQAGSQLPCVSVGWGRAAACGGDSVDWDPEDLSNVEKFGPWEAIHLYPEGMVLEEEDRT